VKNPDFWAEIILDWHVKTTDPKVAKRIMLGFWEQDEIARKILRELVLCAGDWRRAGKNLLENRKLPADRVRAFLNYAEKLTKSSGNAQPFIMGMSND
jgi:hypothetical protein